MKGWWALCRGSCGGVWSSRGFAISMCEVRNFVVGEVLSGIWWRPGLENRQKECES